MNSKIFVQIIALLIGIIFITGCQRPCCQQPVDDNTWRAGAAANGTDDQGARTAGLGEEGQFSGDDAGRHGRVAKNTYYFDFDRSDIRQQDIPAIQAHADRMVSANRKAIVEGHTDPRGSREYNIALGERRAKAVAEELKEKGVRDDQVRVLSYGAQRLASEGRNEADYQLDRRAIIKN